MTLTIATVGNPIVPVSVTAMASAESVLFSDVGPERLAISCISGLGPGISIPVVKVSYLFELMNFLTTYNFLMWNKWNEETFSCSFSRCRCRCRCGGCCGGCSSCRCCCY